MAIGIVVDSGCDIPQDIVEKYGIKVIPLRIIINGKEYEEGEISERDLFTHIDDNTKTSLPSPNRILEAFEKLLKEGKDEIITFNISSALSGTFNLFRMVSEDFVKKNVGVKIANIDTLNISIGSGLVVIRALEYIEDGKGFDEIIELVKEDIKKSKVFFAIPTLKYLVKGGRIGKVSAAIGEVLKVKPIISVDRDGVYYTVCKVRGIKKAYEKVFEEFLRFTNDRKFLAAVYVSGHDDFVKEIQKKYLEKIKHLENCKRVFEGSISSTLTVHTGPGLFGIGSLLI